jgi:hypothetical protein
MAEKVLLNLHLTLGSDELTANLKGATLALDSTQLDSSAMGDNWQENKQGLKMGTLQFRVNDDFTASSIDSILWNAYSTGTAVTFTVKPEDAATSTSNPAYSGSVMPKTYTMGGDLDTLAAKDLTWPVTGAVARATA